MNDYEISYSVGHDRGEASAASLDRVATWLRDHRRDYDWSIDNVAVRGPLGEIDVYDLMRRAETGEPLSPPGLLQAEAEVEAILGALRRDAVGQSTLDAVERLRAIIEGLVPGAAVGRPAGASG